MRPRQQVLCLHFIIAELKTKISFLLRVGEWKNSLSLSPILSHNQILQYSYNRATETFLLLYLYREYNLLQLGLFICPSSCSWAPQNSAPFSLGPTLCHGTQLTQQLIQQLKVVCHAHWGNSGSHYILYSSVLLRCFIWSQSACPKFFSFSNCDKNENSKYLSFKINNDCSLSPTFPLHNTCLTLPLCLCAYNIQSTVGGAR